MRIMAGLLGAVAACGGAQAQTLTEAWQAEGFAMPESAYWDEGSNQIVVSNIGVFGPDGGSDGRLSLLSADGQVTDADWVTGLIDPKGLASRDGTLYVADADGLHVVDMATGSLGATVALPGAMLPNDVAVDDAGTVYVTDMLGGGLYRVRDGVADLLVPAGGAPLPNGVMVHDGQIVLGSFGEGLNSDMTVSKPGGLLSVDAETGAVSAMAGTEGTGSVDGITMVGDMIVYNDNPTGRIMGVKDGTLVQIGQTDGGTGDIGTGGGDLILVPSLGGGTVTAYHVK